MTTEEEGGGSGAPAFGSLRSGGVRWRRSRAGEARRLGDGAGRRQRSEEKAARRGGEGDGELGFREQFYRTRTRSTPSDERWMDMNLGLAYHKKSA
jgi:hypothetical protein